MSRNREISDITQKDQTIAGVKTFSSPIVGSTSTQVSKTGDETIAGVKAFTDGLKLQGQNVTPFSGFKNYIINGNFDVWQRDTSQTTNGYGSDDRWYNSNAGSTKTHSQITCTDTERALFNASYFSRTVVSSVAGVGSYVIKRQAVENVTKLAGKTVTLSFWAKADSNKNIVIEFKQFFGTGGSPSAHIYKIGSQKVALTTAWQKKIITVTIPSIIGKTIGTDGVHTTGTDVQFWFDAGSDYNSRTDSLGQQSGTFDIAQVQLEEGSVATPFENRPYGLELSLCQRYFRSLGLNTSWRSIGAGSTNTGTLLDSTYELPIPMRRNPDLSVVGAYSNYTIADGVSAHTPTSIFIQDTSTDCINIRAIYSGGTAGRSAELMTNSANGGILLNAEL